MTKSVAHAFFGWGFVVGQQQQLCDAQKAANCSSCAVVSTQCQTLLLGVLSAGMPSCVLGLLFARLAEANLQGIVRDIIGVYETEGRRAVAEAVSAGK